MQAEPLHTTASSPTACSVESSSTQGNDTAPRRWRRRQQQRHDHGLDHWFGHGRCVAVGRVEPERDRTHDHDGERDARAGREHVRSTPGAVRYSRRHAQSRCVRSQLRAVARPMAIAASIDLRSRLSRDSGSAVSGRIDAHRAGGLERVEPVEHRVAADGVARHRTPHRGVAQG